MVRASIVSRPTLVARKVKSPVVFNAAPKTSSPGVFSTGTLSPVSIDSSTKEAPFTTSPSTGTRSPGLTTTRSPSARSSIAVSISSRRA